MESAGIQRLKALGEEVARLRAEMKAAAKDALKEGTKEIFSEYGDVLHSFGWTQWAPSFNDGEPCEFEIHELIMVSKVDVQNAIEEGSDEEDAVRDFWGDDGSPSFGGWRSEAVDDRHQGVMDAAKIIYGVLDEQLARDVFGDSVKVIFTPDGVDVEDYYAPY